MKIRIRRNPWFSVVLGLITFTFLYFFHDHSSPQKHTHKLPQEYMKHVVMHDFTEDGSLKQILKAHTWSYRPERQESILEKPYLIIHKKEGLWKIQAQSGVVKQPTLGSIENIRLTQQVRLERPPTHALTALSLETETLQYEPKTDTAHSDQFVMIKKPGVEMSGWGLEASFHPDTLTLLKDVHTTYHANS